MAKITKELAAKIAPQLQNGSYWVEARDDVDCYTGSELDAFQLDMLTDWAVQVRKQTEPSFIVNP